MTNSPIVIAGAGITGLATAAWLEFDHHITDVLVVDRAPQAGGKMQSEIADGHTLEWGPQGFLDNAPDTLELVELCGLGDRLVQADEASADRFILRDGKLRSVPTKPPAFLISDILPIGAKLRLFFEAFGARKPDRDETVFAFASRRIGRGAAEVLVDAMVTGVFAGDSRKLSLAATFPKMAAMEAEYGSLTRALISKMREARKNRTKSAGPAGPGGTLSTFTGGMAQLPGTLATRLGDRLKLDTTIEAIDATAGGFTLQGPETEIQADHVLLTTPAHATAAMVHNLAPEAAKALSKIPTAPIAVVMASYADPLAFGKPLTGFGFLIPGGEKMNILGVLFCHAIFPGQAPEGSVFLRAMLGGTRNPDVLDLSDEQLMARVREAMTAIHGRDPEPDRSWVVRWERGISQYTVGHLDRVETIEHAVRAQGLDVAGSPYRGVSVNDCIKQARAAAARIAANGR